MEFVPPLDRKESLNSNPHPYLHGNFAPIHRVVPLTPCSYTGTIPDELVGGEYVRNGSNPVTNDREDLRRDYHMFDGDGMLSGVFFRRKPNGGVQPEFVNQYILTDIYLSTVTTPSTRFPIPISIATMINPAASFFTVISRICRTLFMIILSHLPGSQQTIKKISVANTNVLFHDGRALATCESGPPIRVALPGLQTVGWYDGKRAEGESKTVDKWISGDSFGGTGPLSFFKQWTTAHPRVDPLTMDLVLFHSTFIAPFVHYSIVPITWHRMDIFPHPRRLINSPVPGIKSAKLMHDFGVSLQHSVIMDLPLSIDPLRFFQGAPVVSYDADVQSRFGVFPRWNPSAVIWFTTAPCIIFHVANTWDSICPKTKKLIAVNMLVCRLTSASFIYSAGSLTAPPTKSSMSPYEEEQCRLYVYRFSLTSSTPKITHQFALSTIPFEFPAIRPSKSMSRANFIYGCSLSTASMFSTAVGRAVKIDCLVKVNATVLLHRGGLQPPTPITGAVDTRSVQEIIASSDPKDPIKIFKLPAGWYAQEARFVARHRGKSEDDGWILFYAFDESQLDSKGNALPSAKSELWVVDARNMKTVVARVFLPQRVPYGLHGSWFPEAEVEDQRPIKSFRRVPIQKLERTKDGEMWVMKLWMMVREWALRFLA